MKSLHNHKSHSSVAHLSMCFGENAQLSRDHNMDHSFNRHALVVIRVIFITTLLGVSLPVHVFGQNHHRTQGSVKQSPYNNKALLVQNHVDSLASFSNTTQNIGAALPNATLGNGLLFLSPDQLSGYAWEQNRTTLTLNVPVQRAAVSRNSNTGRPTPSSNVIADFQVNENAGGQLQYGPAIAMRRTGEFVMAWHDYRDGNYDIYAQRFDRHGNPLGRNFKVNSDEGIVERSEPAIAMDEAGRFVVVWRGSYFLQHNIFCQRFDVNGQPVGALAKITDSGTNYSPAIAMKGNGDFIVVWIWNGIDGGGNYRFEVRGQRLSSAGAPISGNFTVTDTISYVDDPDIGMDVIGNFVVAWQDSRDGGYDIYCQRFNEEAQPMGANFKINDDSPATTWQQFPAVFVEPSGEHAIVWRDWRNSDRDPDIYCQLFDRRGAGVGANFRINDDNTQQYQRNPSIAGNSGGEFAVVWSDDRNRPNSRDVYAQKLDCVDALVNGNFQVTSSNWGYIFPPRLGMDDPGNFTFVWEDIRNVISDVFAQRYDYESQAIGGNVKINDDQGSGSVGTPVISAAPTGDFAMAWIDTRQGNLDIYYQHYDRYGNEIGNDVKVNDNTFICSMYNPYLAVDPRGYVTIVWADWRQQRWNIFGQRYDDKGKPIGVNFKINDDEENVYREYPSIAVDAEGNFTVAWFDERGGENIYAQRFDHEAVPFGSNFKVSDAVINTFRAWPEVAMDDSGRTVIVWTDSRDANSNGDVYAQFYDKKGNALGASFKINDDVGTGRQDESDIAMQPDGSFWAIWFDGRNYPPEIYGQRFDRNWQRVGSNFRIEDDEAVLGLTSSEPTVSLDHDGAAIAVWLDERNGTDYYGDPDIYARRFDRNGVALGPSFRVHNDAGKFYQSTPDVHLRNRLIYYTWIDGRVAGQGLDIFARVDSFATTMTSISNPHDEKALKFELHNAYPNPFNPVTTVSYTLTRTGPVRLQILDTNGRLVATLVDGIQNRGVHILTWNGRNHAGQQVSSGMYLCRLFAQNVFLSRKILLTK